MNNRNASCCSASTQIPCSCTTVQPRQDSTCSCAKSRFPTVTAYAMAYVPFQQSGEVYSCDKALSRGTIFPCLDLPFLKGCCK